MVVIETDEGYEEISYDEWLEGWYEFNDDRSDEDR